MNKHSKNPILYTVLIFYSLFTLFPFLWALSASFKPYSEIVTGGLNIIPKEFTVDAYEKLIFGDDLFLKWIINSLFICVTITIANVIFNSLAGYALARLKFRGKGFVFNLILVVIMVPGQVLLIPNYLIIKYLGLLGTYSSIILPGVINASYIFMMRQFYLNFPKEVEEAAFVDGLNRLQVFFKIAIPLALPSIATQALFIFLGSWNEFMRAKLYLTDPSMYTITVGIQSMVSQNSNITQWDEVMAVSMLSLAPILVLYIVLNKYFMKNSRQGSDK